MATTFLEPCGDTGTLTGINNGFWSGSVGTIQIVTDIVHGSHINSFQSRANNGDRCTSLAGAVADAGTRITVYVYIVALPTATATIYGTRNGATLSWTLRLTSAGVLQLWKATTSQVGTDGETLSTGKWYRICVAYTITSTTVNSFKVFVDAAAATISATNVTLTTIGGTSVELGKSVSDTTFDTRYSDLYIDNSSGLTDTGDIWVTAKRPNANGTTNGFTTQIGSGGSGYGTGHSPQVNERPLSTTNGWSMVGAGSAITEEYNIEGKSVGDIDISSATIIDYGGWVSADTLSNETASIIVTNVTSNISLVTSTPKVFLAIGGSTTYPPSTGTDIGIITSTTLTTVKLYECGIMVAYTPGSSGPAPAFTNPNLRELLLMGVGT